MTETEQEIEKDAVESTDAEASTVPETIIRLEDAGPARKKVSIEVPEAAVTAKLEENYQSLKDEAAIPGFRRGHAPRKLLEKRFGQDIRKDVCRQLIGDAYGKAVEDNKLRVLGSPELKGVEDMELPESGPLLFDVEVEIVPEFELPDLADLEVKKPDFEVTEEQVTAEIDRYREMYGQFKPVEQSQPDDYVTGDVVIRDSAGEVLSEAKGAQLLVPGERRKGKGAIGGILVDDLGTQLTDKKLGDSVTIKTTGPERHEDDKIAGKEISIELSISRIERMHALPVETLMEMMGQDDEASLREQITDALQKRAEMDQRRAMGQQLIEALLEKVEMELPAKLSGRQAESILRRHSMELMQRGVSQDDMDQSLAEMRAASEQQARDQLKQLFVLDAVAQKLEIEVSEGEVNGRIVHIARQHGYRPERLREQMLRNGQLDQLYVQIREEKAVARLVETAKVSEISAEEWQKSQEQKTGEPAEAVKKKTTKKKSTKKKSRPAAAKQDKEAE